MNQMKKILKYILLDLLRNRILIGYTLLLFVLSMSVFNLESNTSKGLMSLLNINLIILPLVSIIFSTIYIYNSGEFIELLLSQPLQRNKIWRSMGTALSTALSISFFIGCGIPILIYEPTSAGLMMAFTGILLNIIFVSLASLAAVYTRDKARGIGIAILLWLFFTLLYDGLVLFIMFQFMDYPLEKAMIAMSMMNPIDLARVLILLKIDIAALMGVTSAVFHEFFGQTWGMLFSFLVMLCWSVIPMWLSIKQFGRKNM